MSVTAEPASHDGQIILFDHQEGERVVVSYFDTADPNEPEPIDLIVAPGDGDWKLLGLFNGTLYFLSPERRLVAADLETGECRKLYEPLSERYVRKDSLVISRPNGDQSPLVRLIDFNAGATRTVAEPGGGWWRYDRSQDELRYLLWDGRWEYGTELTMTFRVQDLRFPDAAPFDFEVITPVPEPAWDTGPRQLLRPPSNEVNLVRRKPPVKISFDWLSGNRFACIGTGFVRNGQRFPPDNRGGWCLFVVDSVLDTVQHVPLAPLVGRGYKVPPWRGYGEEMYDFDTEAMELLDPDGLDRATATRACGPHFALTEVADYKRVLLHGREPVTIERETGLDACILDKAGERVVMRRSGQPRSRGACYDIYFGQFAAVEYRGHYNWADASELRRDGRPLPEGWESLEKMSEPTIPVTTIGVAADVPGRARRDRRDHYTLRVEAEPQDFAGKRRILVTFTIEYNGDEPSWTDPPWPMFPIVTGTLRGPASTRTLQEIPFAVPNSRPEAALLENGQSLEGYMALEDLPDGEYTLAAAYNGNSQSEWRGQVRASLVSFVVGEPTDPTSARLKYVIQSILDAKSSSSAKRYLDELERAGRSAVPEVIAALDRVKPPPEDAPMFSTRIHDLYSFLEDRPDPELLPFYIGRVQSDNRHERGLGYSAIRELYRRSEDAGFRDRLLAVIQDAYEYRSPVARASVMDDFEHDFWPGFFDEMKILAVEGDLVGQREAADVLMTYYLRKFDTFHGEVEDVLNLIAENKQFPGMDYQAVSGLKSFYTRRVDVAEVLRAIDQYRVRFPHILDGDYFGSFGELWDIDWLIRAANDPTEARYHLVLRSVDALKAHCGTAPGEAFPNSWEALQADETARAAYRETLQAWAECLKEKPATFRVPVMRK